MSAAFASGSSCSSARSGESRARAAAAWTGREHLGFLDGVGGDGHVDIVGFDGPEVHVARNLYDPERLRVRLPG
ncbi:hypothetical protein ABT404_00550 [Streptomyces hyaluromycini]|uniref:Uncharacterized protein n=1 Tax=Streptomyces hyaluromycini TaxID=1377993 RepID=A0ABV1WMA1_9ACTN